MAELIDRDALLKRLQEQQKYGSTADSRGRAKAIVEVIHAPTIAPEVRHGRWTEKGHCECCGFDMGSRVDKWTNVYNFAYCPNCGAKMDGKDWEHK